MRRYVIPVVAVALVAVGTYTISTAVQRNGSCPPSQSTETNAPSPPDTQAPGGAIAGNFDSAMSGVCRYACATKVEYKAADVLAQPGARPGKLTQCPVSGVVLVVDEGRPRVLVAGSDFVACCGNCAAKLQQNPGTYLKA